MIPIIAKRRTKPTLPRYSAERTRHLVNSFCDAPEAERVSLVVVFNEWEFAANPKGRTGGGRGVASSELAHGQHHCRFVVDGKPILTQRKTS